MSVLIKGMKMPTSCFMCYLSYLNGERLFCYVTKEEVIRGKRASECPLIELQSPHGKLIDVSSLDPYNDMWKRKCIPMEMVYNARAVAYEAPAILEAEVEE